MARKTTPAHLVKQDMTILVDGLRWVVLESLYDLHGNGPNQPRQIIICDAHPDRAKETGVYMRGVHFSFETSAIVDLGE
jgi:hypothetical protein